jgi:hypothetical protein
MNQLTSTKLFLALQEASQKGIDLDVQVLEDSYDEFVNRLFKDSSVIDKSAYRDLLVYTHVELTSLTGVSGKKCRNLPEQSHPID